MIDHLTHLLPALHARAPDAILGWCHGTPVPVATFLARVTAWSDLLASIPHPATALPAADSAHSAAIPRHLQCALYLEDSLDFAAALLACWQAGHTVWLSADTLTPSCSALAEKVDCFIGQFPRPWPARTLDTSAPWPVPATGEQAIAAAVASTVAASAFAAFDPAAVCLVVHTSGSTGAAQAIPKQLHQLAAEVATLEAVFGERMGDAAIVATVSHQHIYGLLFKVLWPLAAGRPVHAHSESYPEPLLALLTRQPSVLITSPAHLKRLPAHLDWARAPLRAVFSSGGPLPADVAQSSASLLGEAALEVFGSSETGGVAWRQRTRGATLAISLDTPWQALPDVAWRIAADGQTLEVRSPHLPDNTWLTLADRAQAVDASRFLLLGRLDRIVKLEEKRVSLDAIEALLCASPLVAQARVLLCDASNEAAGPSRRQQLAAFVVPSPQGQAQLDETGKPAFNQHLRQLLQHQVEAVALPRRWRYLTQLPLNPQGKTTHAMLLALLDAARPRLPHMRELAHHSEGGMERVTLEITVPPDLLYFDGHFAQVPILPGVVQVDWALHYGRQYFALPARFSAMHALKFQFVVQPDYPVTLELQHDRQKASLQFRYFSSAGQHASGRLLFVHPITD